MLSITSQRKSNLHGCMEAYDMDVQVDKDRLEFLMYACFGVGENPYQVCSKLAYLDLCRTLRFNGDNGDLYREHIDTLLEQEITKMLSNVSCDQNSYDVWHRGLCEKIVAFHTKEGQCFSIGQAQKWINMTMKYLYIQNSVSLENITT
jgi:hypothetical protein